jgi:hypothetical protein
MTTLPFATTTFLSRQYSIWSRAVIVCFSVTTFRFRPVSVSRRVDS